MKATFSAKSSRRMQASPDPWMGSDDWGGDATGKATPPPEVPDAVPPQPVRSDRSDQHDGKRFMLESDRSALKIEREIKRQPAR